MPARRRAEAVGMGTFARLGGSKRGPRKKKDIGWRALPLSDRVCRFVVYRGIGMRIAQVAPLYESCPPRLYGGTERVVSYLTEELVRRGHEVTLFASGDSKTAARLAATREWALRLDPECRDPLAHHLVMLHRVARRADEFDLIHFH